jgi:hypothetical protein
VRSRLALAALAVATSVLLLAPAALAQTDNGEGLAGETTDRVVTFFSLGVLLFFPLVALLFTLIEHRLEQRHERREAAHTRQSTSW